MSEGGEHALFVERAGERLVALETRDDAVCGPRFALQRVTMTPEQDPLEAARAALPGATLESATARDGMLIALVSGECPAASMIVAPSDALARSAAGALDLAPSALRACRQEDVRACLAERDDWVAHGPAIRRMPVRTPTLPPATHTNLFVVGRERAVLVEPATPYDDELDRIAHWVGELEADGVRLEAILATHHHVDHISGARALSQAFSLPIWCHAQTASRLPRDVRAERLLEEDDVIELDGAVLRAIHTPGHAAGHLCFRDEVSGLILVGDMVAGVGTILIEPEDGDMALYLESLERLGRVDASALLPAHGAALRPPERVLGHYVAHRLAREAKVLEALRAHGAPARPGALVPSAYDDAPRAVWGLAALSTEAHLIKLERDGKAVRRGALWSPT